MLATLERPTEGSISPSRTWTPPPAPALDPPAHLRLLAPAAVEPEPSTSLRALAPLEPAVARISQSTGRLRLTVRARRLLAGLVLLSAAAVGAIAVDVLSAVIPAGPTSYVAQEAPYIGAAPGGLVPAAASSVTVESGDTLWSLAERLDPQADPREVIAAIMTLNGLDTPTLQPGQVLLLP
ncbi:MAG: LysM peptidoglycan-binding domain-containing protein [Geodermatophilaceae bacterium]